MSKRAEERARLAALLAAGKISQRLHDERLDRMKGRGKGALERHHEARKEAKADEPRPVGRPNAGRTARLDVLITPEARDTIADYAGRNGISLVEAVEAAARAL